MTRALAAALVPILIVAQVRDPEVELEEIAELLQLSARSVVADVGAGGGSWTFRLAERVGEEGHVFSTDVKEPQVDGIRSGVRARGLTNVTVILGTEQDMGLPEECCDALLLRLVYHAFDDPTAMRESLSEAMRPGGRVLIVDFRPEPRRLTGEMAAAGFERIHFVDRWQGQEGVYAALFREPAR